MFDWLLSVLFPRTCLSCGRFGRYCCSGCENTLTPILTPICPVCTYPAIDGSTHPRCMTRYSLDGLVSVFRYSGLVKKAIKQLKYGKVTDIAPELGALCGRELVQNTSNVYRSFRQFVQNKPVIVPIPLHWKKNHARWFNQSELLGKHVSDLLQLELRSDILVRSVYTDSQAGQKKEDRLKNMKGVFSLSSQIESVPSTIMLFDDVWTTGATMREAGNVLKRNGVKTVWGMTVAR